MGQNRVHINSMKIQSVRVLIINVERKIWIFLLKCLSLTNLYLYYFDYVLKEIKSYFFMRSCYSFLQLFIYMRYQSS